MRARLLLALLALSACKRSTGPASSSSGGNTAPVVLNVADPEKKIALRDLQEDLRVARAAIAQGKYPGYACERLRVAAAELADQKDQGVLNLLADAESVYGLQGPATWADAKLKDAETNPDSKPGDCSTVKEMLNRISGKFKSDNQVTELVKRYKALCPKERGSRGGGGGARAATGASFEQVRAQQRDDCKRRCDDAAFSCRGSCSTCYGCTTDKTWEWCNQQCSNCKQGCEQNEKFCRAACGE